MKKLDIKKMIRNKKVKITCVCAVSVIVILSIFINKANANSKDNDFEYTELYRTELTESISVKGVVESNLSRKVYSNLNYNVKSVSVEVGDVVTAGDILAVLDTTDLDIKTSSQMSNVDASLNSAEVNLANAQKAYDDATSDFSNGVNSQVTSAKGNLETAKLQLQKCQTTYDSNVVLFDSGFLASQEMEQSKRDLDSAKVQYNVAVQNLKDAESTDVRSVERAAENLNTAKVAYENALNISNNTKEELDKELSDSTICSPINGTVTAVYATEGETGKGLMFVVEQTDNLKIHAYVKEYDIGDVKEGLKVIIKSDSTGDDEYEGAVSKIEPAAVKNSSGNTNSSTDVEFGVDISVVSPENALKIGTNARMDIIIEQKDDIYRVPYDAVKKREDGTNSVFVANTNGKLEEIAVTTGLETDFYIQIESEDLSDGAKVINDANGLTSGMKVNTK